MHGAAGKLKERGNALCKFCDKGVHSAEEKETKECDERHCVPCDGPCPKVCVLTESIDSHNIHQLANCSEIEGNLEILNYVFSPHLPHMKTSQMDKVRPSLVEPLKIQDLNVLKSVKIVTGHVALDGGVKRGQLEAVCINFGEFQVFVVGPKMGKIEKILHELGDLEGI
uniref:KH_dom_type_1 domain-containing protein n=1 Tax=Bursaphelenchus xylophilus TaxID=6326 RepID=A0A1I7SAM9_BURXY